MDKAYIGVNFPNLVSIGIMVGVIFALYLGFRTFNSNRPKVTADE